MAKDKDGKKGGKKREVVEIVLGVGLETVGDSIGRKLVTPEMIRRIMAFLAQFGVTDLGSLAQKAKLIARLIAGLIPGLSQSAADGLEGFFEGFTNEAYRRGDNIPDDEDGARKELRSIALSQKGTLEKAKAEQGGGGASGKKTFFDALTELSPAQQRKIAADIEALPDAEKKALHKHASEAAFTAAWLKGICVLDDATRRTLLGGVFAVEAKKEAGLSGLMAHVAPLLDAGKKLFGLDTPTAEEVTARTARETAAEERRKDRQALHGAMRSSRPIDADPEHPPKMDWKAKLKRNLLG